MMFAMKIGISLATAASGVALGAVGFAPNAEQSAESLLAIRMLFAGLPCFGFLTGALMFRRFRPATDAGDATIADGLITPRQSASPAVPTSVSEGPG